MEEKLCPTASFCCGGISGINPFHSGSPSLCCSPMFQVTVATTIWLVLCEKISWKRVFFCSYCHSSHTANAFYQLILERTKSYYGMRSRRTATGQQTAFFLGSSLSTLVRFFHYTQCIETNGHVLLRTRSG